MAFGWIISPFYVDIIEIDFFLCERVYRTFWLGTSLGSLWPELCPAELLLSPGFHLCLFLLPSKSMQIWHQNKSNGRALGFPQEKASHKDCHLIISKYVFAHSASLSHTHTHRGCELTCISQSLEATQHHALIWNLQALRKRETWQVCWPAITTASDPPKPPAITVRVPILYTLVKMEGI